MSLNTVFDIAGSAMSAETTRLSTSAENMSNANVSRGSPDEVYQPKYPIFETVQEKQSQWMGDQIKAGVQVKGIYESDVEPTKRYEPNNPIADEKGFVYSSNVNYVEQMANVISASRSYQMNVELINTTKQLMQRTLQLGE
ncbi:flagellar basal body rod protein FlgC [Legionella maioricensis]|uniref:Flagellar basal-body rod protein FlgC n=1 Tax=Legionella maioricensis TaxID=2896528 RepID=A0A9X2D355_9GAMM|nr:flagellar basal body rod protein FlgC [Legionella maioricensis]MCL9685382.1 flagellar basal body rod protein FlgC [Legionella maioricensis]MCL9688659.1 flagellar basal body rod protein FlgC [Legionella maioricensis]